MFVALVIFSLDEIALLSGEDRLEVENADGEHLLRHGAIAHVRARDLELELALAGLQTDYGKISVRDPKRFTLMPSSQSWYTLKTGSMGVSSRSDP